MQILFLSPIFPYPLDTGIRIRVFYLLQALAKNHSITLVTLNPKRWSPAKMEGVNGLCEEVFQINEDPFTRSRWRMSSRFLSPTPIVNLPYKKVSALVDQLHHKKRFDVVIASTELMAMYAVAVEGAKRILEEHNSMVRWMSERYFAQTTFLSRIRCWVSWRKAEYYDRRIYRRFNLITMVSKQDVAATTNLFANQGPKIAEIPNGVNCTEFRPKVGKPVAGRLIFSGALAYESNLEAMQYFLTQIFPIIKLRRPEVTLHITGSAAGADLTTLPIGENIVLTGYVDDIRQEIASAEVALAPIRSGGGTRIKILEAMALGTPVVATSKAAEGLDVVHQEHLLLADDPESFARETLSLLNDPQLRDELAINARRLVVERYDWQKLGERFVGLVEDVAQSGVDISNG